jgi:hypothetical protein
VLISKIPFPPDSFFASSRLIPRYPISMQVSFRERVSFSPTPAVKIIAKPLLTRWSKNMLIPSSG